METAQRSREIPYVLEEEVEKAAKLASQWPKPHGCRDRAAFITRETWESWPLYHRDADAFASWEMKHCPNCGSTLKALTDIHDMGAE